jgi:hypothetical protein
LPGTAGEEVEELCLRHERHVVVARGQAGVVSDGDGRGRGVEPELAGGVMPEGEQGVAQAEFVEQFQGVGMQRVAPKIAVEVAVGLQQAHGDAGPAQQVGQHHPARAAAHHHTAQRHRESTCCVDLPPSWTARSDRTGSRRYSVMVPST